MLELEPWRAFEFYKSFLRWYADWYNPRYLEIGCGQGELGMTLKAQRRMGVDIVEGSDWATYRSRGAEFFLGTSDEFFALPAELVGEWDLIFIDGDHSRTQVLRDVYNSLDVLAEGGLIAMHDTLPPTRDHTHEKWSGTAYEAAIELRGLEDLEVYTFPVTYGLTLVGKIGAEFPWAL